MQRPHRIRQEGPLEAHGMMWVNESMGWKRWLLRRYTRSGVWDFQPLVHVDATRDCCLGCLSQGIVVFEGKVHCGDCHIQYTIIEG